MASEPDEPLDEDCGDCGALVSLDGGCMHCGYTPEHFGRGPLIGLRRNRLRRIRLRWLYQRIGWDAGGSIDEGVTVCDAEDVIRLQVMPSGRGTSGPHSSVERREVALHLLELLDLLRDELPA